MLGKRWQFFCIFTSVSFCFSRLFLLPGIHPDKTQFPSLGPSECWHTCFFTMWEQCEQNPMFLHLYIVCHLMQHFMIKKGTLWREVKNVQYSSLMCLFLVLETLRTFWFQLFVFYSKTGHLLLYGSIHENSMI